MATADSKRGTKIYDAARTRGIILDAAERIFAGLGYSAARIDVIAKESGYNKSLIYQYFGDKLGLYTEVVKRADQIGEQITGTFITELLKNELLVTDAAAFKSFLRAMTREMVSFLLSHPSYLKILFWEAAEDWKTWNQITYRPDDGTQFYDLAIAAKQSGILRQDLDPRLFPILIMNVTTATLQSAARYEHILGERDSPQLKEQLIEQIAQFIIHGVMEPSLL
ncbi:TetR/AcrR family transcriptional regulator [Paenibacillus sp. MMS20-IR301]|uniref:TetR/AcrR family transcriptional regulator n=1 Tax=Paenibacillus sp. MMS20-IR301 TaxID=2895946 RepID=UPI0028F0F3A7|nr:TetR/AcrR family transcriptional regulator [Paenibacillus sp. MMS20-IR301]WNS42392.1 TetR/AcrR family transcriptional regulator [Paenibacillus sp. MMS20-IR301]